MWQCPACGSEFDIPTKEVLYVSYAEQTVERTISTVEQFEFLIEQLEEGEGYYWEPVSETKDPEHFGIDGEPIACYCPVCGAEVECND
jgi:phage terminase large subunit GpA-like protein